MCEGFARCILIVSNILFLIFGVLCLAIGIWVRVDKSDLVYLFRISSDYADTGSYDVPSLLESGAYVLIGVGAVVFVISVFGFCGAIRKSRCCLLTYGVLVGLVLVVQVAAGIAVVVFKNQFDTHAKEFLKKTLPEVYDGPYKHDQYVSLALDALQASQSCCGLEGPQDFAYYTKMNKTWNGAPNAAVIPFTCCPSKNKDSYPDNYQAYITGMTSNTCPTDINNGYQNGCYDKIRELAETYYGGVLGVAFGIAALELILIIIACCVAKQNKDEIV